MRLRFYTLDTGELKNFSKTAGYGIPEHEGEDGYFSIGSASNPEDEDGLAGVAQFHLDVDEAGECYGILDYIFVEEEYRRLGIGVKLANKLSRILKQSGIKRCLAKIPDDQADIESFLKECGFLPTKEKKNDRTYIRFNS